MNIFKRRVSADSEIQKRADLISFHATEVSSRIKQVEAAEKIHKNDGATVAKIMIPSALATGLSYAFIAAMVVVDTTPKYLAKMAELTNNIYNQQTYKAVNTEVLFGLSAFVAATLAARVVQHFRNGKAGDIVYEERNQYRRGTVRSLQYDLIESYIAEEPELKKKPLKFQAENNPSQEQMIAFLNKNTTNPAVIKATAPEQAQEAPLSLSPAGMGA